MMDHYALANLLLGMTMDMCIARVDPKIPKNRASIPIHLRNGNTLQIFAFVLSHLVFCFNLSRCLHTQTRAHSTQID